MALASFCIFFLYFLIPFHFHIKLQTSSSSNSATATTNTKSEITDIQMASSSSNLARETTNTNPEITEIQMASSSSDSGRAGINTNPEITEIEMASSSFDLARARRNTNTEITEIEMASSSSDSARARRITKSEITEIEMASSSPDSEGERRNTNPEITEVEMIREMDSSSSARARRNTKSEITEIEMIRKMDYSSTAPTRTNIKTSITDIQKGRKMPSTATAVPGSSVLARALAHARGNPSYRKFMQQELPAQRPVITPRVIISVFLFISAVFISIGVASLIASRQVVEIVYGYESKCLPTHITDKVAYIQDPTSDKTCNITLKVPKDMKAPIFVYYQLENFYQNHARYVKSRNKYQLRNQRDMSSTKGCKPEDVVVNGTVPIVPCGLVAWSLFNDTYSFSVNGTDLMVNKSGISWKSDREQKFGKHVFPQNFQNGSIIGGARLKESIPLSEQEDLIVWMRTAALPTFRKLYGRIEEDLTAGAIINVTLKNQYNTYSFNGKKKLVLSTTSWIGGKNDFIGIAFLTVGGVCLFLALFFTIGFFVKSRQLGNLSDLSWNRKQA